MSLLINLCDAEGRITAVPSGKLSMKVFLRAAYSTLLTPGVTRKNKIRLNMP